MTKALIKAEPVWETHGGPFMLRVQFVQQPETGQWLMRRRKEVKTGLWRGEISFYPWGKWEPMTEELPKQIRQSRKPLFAMVPSIRERVIWPELRDPAVELPELVQGKYDLFPYQSQPVLALQDTGMARWRIVFLQDNRCEVDDEPELQWYSNCSECWSIPKEDIKGWMPLPPI